MKYIRNKFKKGFTLIELLAVIVILAIIALIATPRIMAAIEQARKEAFRNDVYGIVKAVERDYVKRILDEEKVEVTYEFNDYVQTVTPEHIDELAFTGRGPKNGTIIVDEDGNIDLALDDDNWCCKLGEDGEVILKDINEGPCEIGSVFVPSGGSWTFEVTTESSNERFAFAVADIFNVDLTVDWGDGSETSVSSLDFNYDGNEEKVYNIYRHFLNVFDWYYYDGIDEEDEYMLDDLLVITYLEQNHPGLIDDYMYEYVYYAQDVWEDPIFLDLYDNMDRESLLAADPELDELYSYVIDQNNFDNISNLKSGFIVENTYDEAGTYEVILTGVSTHLSFCSVDAIFTNYWWCPDTTPELLTDILTPIPLGFGLTTAYAMFVNADNINELTAQNFFDEASSNIIDLTSMFYGATNFNTDVSSWDTSNVKSMAWTFSGTEFFNQNLGSWNTESVLNMDGMFSWARAFNQEIGSWNVSNVVDMGGMFQNSPFNGDISSWDTGNVKDMEQMFDRASDFDQDIGGWDTSNVETMSVMFGGGSSFNQNIGNWNTENVTNMNRMFDGATVFNQNISGWCVTNISSPPTNFRRNSALTELNSPVWGTCP